FIGAAYSYSTESDYQAHFVSLSSAVELFQRNTTLGLTLGYGNDSVALRMGPTLYNPIGGFHAFPLLMSGTQLLSARLLFNASYELGLIGFGDINNGYQANPYRSVNLGGAPAREQVPYQRLRNSASAAFHIYAPTGGRVVPYLAFRIGYRFYWDDWG